MRLKLFHIILGIVVFSEAEAQITLSRQVVGTAGGQTDLGANISWSYTLGEAVVGTRNYEDFSLTQGFQQPLPTTPLQFELVFAAASRPTSTDGSASVFMIAGCTPPYDVMWSNGISGLSNDRLSPGLYSVTVRSVDCEMIQSFTIEPGPQENCVLRFFNVFSPNGDAVNNTWRIENIGLPEYATNEVEIFNRWGQLIWSGKNYDNTNVVWDGKTANGLELPDATYFYVANVNDQTFKGYVEITR